MAFHPLPKITRNGFGSAALKGVRVATCKVSSGRTRLIVSFCEEVARKANIMEGNRVEVMIGFGSDDGFAAVTATSNGSLTCRKVGRNFVVQTERIPGMQPAETIEANYSIEDGKIIFPLPLPSKARASAAA